MTEPLFKAGDKCPCKDCPGVFVNEHDGEPEFEYPICPVCGYCPEDQFDGRIEDCPACQSFAHIINQGNIICSGCTLELTADDEETAIKTWNGLPRKPKESNHAS